MFLFPFIITQYHKSYFSARVCLKTRILALFHDIFDLGTGGNDEKADIVDKL